MQKALRAYIAYVLSICDKAKIEVPSFLTTPQLTPLFHLVLLKLFLLEHNRDYSFELFIRPSHHHHLLDLIREANVQGIAPPYPTISDVYQMECETTLFLYIYQFEQLLRQAENAIFVPFEEKVSKMELQQAA